MVTDGSFSSELFAWATKGGLILSVILASWWAKTIMRRMEDYEQTRIMGYQRLASLEAKYESIESRLERIERKLDSLNGRH